MLEQAPGTLSDSEFLKAITTEPKLVATIKEHFKSEADGLIKALSQGLQHSLEDDAYNLIVDTLLNEGEVLSEFTGKGSDGAYSIQVVGFDNLCYVRAAEFDDVGVFPNIDTAENFIIDNWADNLESHEPQRTAYAFEAMRRHASSSSPKTPKRQDRPEPQIRIHSRGYAKLGADNFLALQSRLLNGDEKFNAEELAKHFFQQSFEDRHYNEVRTGLEKIGWKDVGVAFERLVDARRKLLQERLQAFKAGKT